jgi:hypothetical protein
MKDVEQRRESWREFLPSALALGIKARQTLETDLLLPM